MPDTPTVLDPDVSDTLTDEERRRLRDGCDRGLLGHGIRKPADLLAELATLSQADLTADVYGDGVNRRLPRLIPRNRRRRWSACAQLIVLGQLAHGFTT